MLFILDQISINSIADFKNLSDEDLKEVTEAITAKVRQCLFLKYHRLIKRMIF